LRQLDGEDGTARKVAARPGETGDQTGSDRVGTGRKDDRDRRGRALRCECLTGTTTCCDDIDLSVDESGS
jgi:hypothetical protein